MGGWSCSEDTRPGRLTHLRSTSMDCARGRAVTARGAAWLGIDAARNREVWGRHGSAHIPREAQSMDRPRVVTLAIASVDGRVAMSPGKLLLHGDER